MTTLQGLGTATPERGFSPAESLAFLAARTAPDDRQLRQLEAIYRRSGVRRRHLLGLDAALYPADAEPSTTTRMEWYAEHAGPLARSAAEAALADARQPAGHVSHLVTVSCTGFVSPGVEFHLIDALGLAPTVQRTHVGFMGCHGLLNGLGVASAYARDPAARVLVTAVELCSLHLQYGWDPDRAVSQALFADGAAALVLGAPDEGSLADGWSVAAVGSLRVPGSAAAMGWTVGSAGFVMSLSATVPALIAEHLRPWLGAWLSEQGTELDEVGSWAVHPGGPRVLDEVERCLDLPRAATAVSREVLAEAGNMSSATLGFIIQRLRARDAPRPCVALAFGPGLIVEAALLA